MKALLCLALLATPCPSVPDEHTSVPVTLPAGCVLPFDVVAYSAKAYDALRLDESNALAKRDRIIKTLQESIDSIPPPVSRVEWFTRGAAAGAAIIAGAVALNWAL
jgi:hypothetical protein